MAIDKPLHLFSDTRALRLGYFTTQTRYVDFVTTSVGGLTITPAIAAQTVTLANTANLAVGGTLAVTGTSTLTGDVIASLIRRATADGADNSAVTISGGGGSGTTRGGLVLAYGNEHGNTGAVELRAGDVTGGHVTLWAGETERVRISRSGLLLVGTTVEASAVAGDVVLANAKALRGVTAAGTDTAPLIGLTAGNYLALGGGYSGSLFAQILGAVVGGLNVGGATANGTITLDTTNNRFVYYSGGNRYYLTGTAF